MPDRFEFGGPFRGTFLHRRRVHQFRKLDGRQVQLADPTPGAGRGTASAFFVLIALLRDKMSLSPGQLKLCSCNGTMKIDADALARSLELGAVPQVCRELCRHEAHRFQQSLAAGEDLVVACTQEAALLRELAQQADFKGKLGFINIREAAGWSREGERAQPKMAALLSLAALPDPQPVPAVPYRSEGALLIVGPLDAALGWAEQLKAQFDVGVLASGTPRGSLPVARAYPVWSGNNLLIKGFLGSFEVTWDQENPIDLALCTRCNACLRACPEQAIDESYQIDGAKCRSHRACVAACGSIGAIDFDRVARARSERFDLILDLSAEPLIRLPHPPQGYQAPGRDVAEQFQAVLQLARLVGEFEKPKYFEYKEKLCAHARNEIVGCTRCLDVCSTGAISAAGNGVAVESHLCMGCGGCATVCPSGAMRYAYPRVADMGLRLKTLLATYRRAGGRDACLLFHAEGTQELLLRLGRAGPGLPARVMPLAVHDVASLGLDLLLGALAWGASQCVILSRGDEPEGYLDASARQIEIGNLMLNGLGYTGPHLVSLRAADAAALGEALWALEPAVSVGEPAGFNLSDDKRSSIDFAMSHLLRHAPLRPEAVVLPAGAAYGTVHLDKGKCTLCMACVGACPASALMDSPDTPRIRFVERNCLQCGLCVKTCPEDALRLETRLLLTEDVRRERVLNEAEPFHCVKCGKAFGTRQMIAAMLGRLDGHSMFAGEAALDRLKMCADCRVLDMMENRNELTIHDL